MSGACFNPVVGLCQTIYQSIFTPTLTYGTMYIYIIAPALGGLLAGFFSVKNLNMVKNFEDILNESQEEVEDGE